MKDNIHTQRRLKFPAVILLIMVMGCNDLTNSQTFPPDTITPEAAQNAAAAYGMANNARVVFTRAVQYYVLTSGWFTDELQWNYRGDPRNETSSVTSTDARITPENLWVSQFDPYGYLHEVRGAALQAIGALAKYAPDSSAARQGYLHALIGYAETMLADLYCSGVPLSTLDFERGYTYRPSSTTRQVYTHAIAQFDTALALAADSTPIVNLASVGKARALLALGLYDSAAGTVRDVPPGFVHAVDIKCCTYFQDPDYWTEFARHVSVATHEGGRTIINPDNPRTRGELIQTLQNGNLVYAPIMNRQGNVYSFRIATGIEARLIAAEAALHANAIPEWLNILNTLRADHPETALMPALIDPGDSSKRVDTLFSERAQWLFLAGHRQGDLRRMVRQYGRIQRNVYPSGPYPGKIVNYGSDVTLPIPAEERANALFKGCIDRRA